MPSLALACRLSAVSRASRRPFSPASLFSSGEQGVWYDPSDFSTLFQDAAGTIPVTAVEQPVGKMLDKSGRGNHATQATVTKRPILKIDGNGKYYLLFDGVDDAMQTGNIDFTSTDKMTVWAGVRKLSDAARGVLFELGNAANTAAKTIALDSPSVNTFAGASAPFANFHLVVKGASIIGPESYANYCTTNTFPAPVSDVISGTTDLTIKSNFAVTLRINASTPARAVSEYLANALSGKYENSVLYIGSRGGTSLPFNGHLYSLIVRGAKSSEAQILSAEAYCNQKTGAY